MTQPDAERLVSKFSQWWSNPLAHSDFKRSFRPDLVYRWGPRESEHLDAIASLEAREPWEAVTASSISITANTVRFVLEGRDPIASARFRIDFRLVLDNDSIAEVIERESERVLQASDEHRS